GLLPDASLRAEPAKTGAFAAAVRPFLSKHCYDCHGPERQRGGVSFSKYKDEAAALQDRKTWKKVVQALQSHAMPPKKRPQPTAAEIEPILSWIQANTKIDCSLPIDPGRVTIRRLNRAEYKNTIRDLLGVDFKPVDDFPTDDVGYGFD